MTPELKEKLNDALYMLGRTTQALKANINDDLSGLQPDEQRNIIMFGMKNLLMAKEQTTQIIFEILSKGDL